MYKNEDQKWLWNGCVLTHLTSAQAFFWLYALGLLILWLLSAVPSKNSGLVVLREWKREKGGYSASYELSRLHLDSLSV